MNWIKRKLSQFIENRGYVSESYHQGMLHSVRTSWEKRVEQEHNLNLDRLISEIRMVNMIKVRLENPIAYRWYDFTDLSQPPSVAYTEDKPPDSRWYTYQVMIDVPKLQRIYQELHLSQDSYEFEYLKASVLRNIEKNLDALMKVELGVR